MAPQREARAAAPLVRASSMRNCASVATKRWLRPKYSAPSGVGEMKLTSHWPDFVTGKAALMAGGRLARASGATATRYTGEERESVRAWERERSVVTG